MGINHQKTESFHYADTLPPHLVVLEYMRKLWNGGKRDKDFEQKSLSDDLDFNSYNFAELIFAISNERNLPKERVVHFLRVGITGGGDNKLANLLERIFILAEQFDEKERFLLLESGVVGDGKEIFPIARQFDSVDFVLRYCRVIESVKDLKDHDAIDAEYGWVDTDEGWE